MSLRRVGFASSLVILLGGASLAISQDSGQLSQKLLLESTIQQRVTNAISKILDESQFVVDVKVELTFGATRRAETVYGTPDGRLVDPQALLGGTAAGVVAGRDASARRVVNPFPIPGFPAFERADAEGELRALEEAEPSEGTAASGSLAEAETGGITTETGGLPTIESLAISVILEDGVSPQIIENVRQVTLVASRFDRDRGDVLSITTAAFKNRFLSSPERASAGTALAQVQARTQEAENLRQTLDEARTRNEELMQELRNRELEYLERSEDERKQALADLAQVQDERAKDLIFLQQQREEQNTRLQEALLHQIDEMRKDLTSGRLTPDEGGIVTAQVTSLEDSLAAMRMAFAAERQNYEDQINNLLQPVEPPRAGFMADNQILLALMGVAVVVALAIIAVALINSRNRAQQAPAAMLYPPARPYPRRRPRRPAPKEAKPKAPVEEAETVAAEAQPAEADEAETVAAEVAEEVKTAAEEVVGAVIEPALAVEVRAQEDTAVPASHVEEDPEVLQSEVGSLRQSVVSLSVGKPESATRIVSSWLQQGAPSEAAAEEGESPEAEETVEEEEES